MKKEKVLILLLFIFSLSSKAQGDIEIKLDSIGFNIDKTLSENNKEYINSIYNLEELSKLFLNSSKNKKIKKFNSDFYNGLSSSFDFGNIILEQINNGASYDYLNYYKDEKGDYYLLFRLYGDGLNYHEHLIKKINNEIRIVDTYVYLTGEFLSDTFRSIYKGVLYKGGLMGSLGKKDNPIDDLLILQKIKKFKSEGDYQKAYDLYQGLSKKAKSKKIFKIINLLVTAKLEEEKYIKAINDYEKMYPNDASLFLVSLDGYILRKKYDKALNTIDNLDRIVGGDSFLNYFRGNIYYLKLDYENAEIKFKKVIEDYPNYLDTYDSLLAIYIEKNNEKEAIKLLEIMVNDLSFPRDILYNTLKENYPIFSKNEEIIKWSKQK